MIAYLKIIKNFQNKYVIYARWADNYFLLLNKKTGFNLALIKFKK